MAACSSWSEASLQARACETERGTREWAGKGGREIKSEVRDDCKCASIIWRARRICCCGLGAGHYVSSYLGKNVDLNTAVLTTHTHKDMVLTEPQMSGSKSDDACRFGDERSSHCSDTAVCLEGTVGLALPEVREASGFSFHSCLALIFWVSSHPRSTHLNYEYDRRFA